MIANTVGDDVGVQGVLLTLSDEGIGGQEGALVGLASGTTELEVDGGSAVTEVGAGLSGADWDSCSGCRHGSEGEKEESFELHFGECLKEWVCCVNGGVVSYRRVILGKDRLAV